MRKTNTGMQPWSYCERCWFRFPLGMLTTQLGLRVCTVHCADNLDIMYRPFVIQSVLGDDSKELMPITPEIQENSEEILF